MPETVNSTALPDAGNSTSAAYTITRSSIITGTVGGADIGDWFRFVAVGAGEVRAWLSGLSADLDLYVDSDAGPVVSSRLGATSDEYLSLQVAAGSVYYVSVRPWAAFESAYALSIELLGTVSANRSPVANGNIADLSWPEARPASYQVPATLFSDPDGDALTYFASTFSIGLPGWLTFDSSTLTLSGTPPAGTADVVVTISAMDPSRASESRTFLLQTPAASAAAPERINGAVISDVGSSPNMAYVLFSSSVITGSVGGADPSDWFAIVTHGSGRVRAKLSNLHADLELYLFPANGGGAQSERPGTQDEEVSIAVVAGVYYVRVQPYGAAQSTYTLEVDLLGDSAPNRAPVASAPIANRSWTEGQLGTYQVPASLFTDPDGDALAYSASAAVGALPSWLGFDTSSRTFSGTPPAGAADIDVELRVSDVRGGTVLSVFTVLTPAAPAAPPELINGRAVPDVGNSASSAYMIVGDTEVIGSVGGADSGDYYRFVAPASGLVRGVVGGLSADVDLFIGSAGGVGVSSEQAGTNEEAATLAVTVGAEYFVRVYPFSGAVSSYALNIDLPAPVLPDNRSPQVNGYVATLSWPEGRPASYRLPPVLFSDPDGDVLTLSASDAGGALPNWLTFDASLRTFSGTPPAGTGDLSLAVRAQDASGATVTATFGLETPDGAPSDSTFLKLVAHGSAAVLAGDLGLALRSDHLLVLDYLMAQYRLGHKPLLYIGANIDAGELASFGIISAGPEAAVKVVIDVPDLLGLTPEGREGRISFRFEVGVTAVTAGMGVDAHLGIFEERMDLRQQDSYGYDIEATSLDLLGIKTALTPAGIVQSSNFFEITEASISFLTLSYAALFEWNKPDLMSFLNRIATIEQSPGAADTVKNALLSLADLARFFFAVDPYDGTAGNSLSNGLVGTSSFDIINGNGGNDQIDGLGGDDILEGGSGDDTLRGGDGRDYYVYYRGSGSDTIDEGTSNAPATDVLQIRDNASLIDLDGLGDLRFRRDGNDLVIRLDIVGDFFTSDSGTITIKNQFVDLFGGVEVLQIFDDDGAKIGGDIDLMGIYLWAGSEFALYPG